MKFSWIKVIILITIILITGLLSCEIMTGGNLRVYNGHSTDIRVTIRDSSKNILYEDRIVETGSSRTFTIDDNGTYTITSDKNDATRELVANGLDSVIKFPVNQGYDDVIELW